MDKKTQAGLEYLMTYGWALILIAAIIGALVFLVATPGEQPIFSSTGQGKILVKGSSFSQGSVVIKLQNITGGTIRIIEFTGFGGSCEINGKITGEEFSIGPGGELLVECDATADFSVPLSIEYKDPAGLTQSTIITPSNVPESKCGNGTLDIADGEECDTLGNVGVPAIAGLSCRPGCKGINVSQCTGASTLSQPKTYYLANNIAASVTTCITIASGTLDCDYKEMNLGSTSSRTGVNIWGPATVRNCTIIGTGTYQKGIYFSAGGTSAISIANNTISLQGTGSYGIHFRSDLAQATATGNNTSTSLCGINIGTPTVPPVGANTCGKCFQITAGNCDRLCGAGGWTSCP